MSDSPTFDEFEAMMQEHPAAGNNGRGAVSGATMWEDDWAHTASARRSSLSPTPEGAWMADGGFSVIDTGGGGSSGKVYGTTDMGMSAHRGILSEDEYVDTDYATLMLARHLGFQPEDFEAVYKHGGRLPNHLLELRGRTDAALLALATAGASLVAIATALGVSEKAIDRALARARAEVAS